MNGAIGTDTPIADVTYDRTGSETETLHPVPEIDFRSQFAERLLDGR